MLIGGAGGMNLRQRLGISKEDLIYITTTSSHGVNLYNDTRTSVYFTLSICLSLAVARIELRTSQMSVLHYGQAKTTGNYFDAF